MDPELVARARLYVDSRAAALVESGDVVMGIREQRFDESHVAGELGDVVLRRVDGRTSSDQIDTNLVEALPSGLSALRQPKLVLKCANADFYKV